jgi:hypothetical protein
MLQYLSSLVLVHTGQRKAAQYALSKAKGMVIQMKKNFCIIIAVLVFVLPFTAMAVEEFCIPV